MKNIDPFKNVVMDHSSGICKECIIKPICSEDCYTFLAVIGTGDDAILEVSKQGGWKGIEDLEKDLGLYPEDTVGVYWIMGGFNLKYKFIDLKKLKRKKVSMAEIVGGKFYVCETKAYILPSKDLAVSWL